MKEIELFYGKRWSGQPGWIARHGAMVGEGDSEQAAVGALILTFDHAFSIDLRGVADDPKDARRAARTCWVHRKPRRAARARGVEAEK